MPHAHYDVVIIGGGPAGLTAGMYAARARLKTLLIEKSVIGGQIIVTDWIENYPGFPEGISGQDLAGKMADQAKKFGLEIETNEVMSIDCTEPVKTMQLNDRSISTYAIIVATGASPMTLGVPGEDIYYGRGVSFCATCDGPFFKDSVVAAVGGGDTAIQESIFLTKFVKKIYVIHRRDELRAAKILQEQAFANEKIEFIWDSVLTGISGSSNNVEKVTLKHLKTGDTKDLDVDGCFIWIGIKPNTAFLHNTVQLDKYGFIIADSHMETSVPGIFAAGDGRDTPVRQITSAIGDGAIAAISAEHYINKLKR
jgi:thioredoxin reductase (NADPH)